MNVFNKTRPDFNLRSNDFFKSVVVQYNVMYSCRSGQRTCQNQDTLDILHPLLTKSQEVET